MMLSAKELLLKQMKEAMRGRADMSLMGVLDGITQEEASWVADAGMPTIEQIVRHIAWSKSRFCQRGFGTPMSIEDKSVNEDGDCAELPWEFPCGAGWGVGRAPGIAGAMRLLEEAQKIFVGCLAGLREEELEKEIPTQHGKSAVNFFWTMMMHDIYHAGQIRTRRSMYQVQARKVQ